MKSSKTLIAVAIAALIPFASTAFAGDKDKAHAGATWDSLDTNRDGRISKSEAAADMNIVFSTADANADGYLDSAEFKKARKAGYDDSTSQPKSKMPADASGQPDTNQPDQSAAPPSDTTTPRQ